MNVDTIPSPIRLKAEAGPEQPEPSPELEELYRGFERELLVPLWTEIGDLMPLHPQTKATAHLWRWDNLVALADRAGHLVPVGRGGERRAIALANPSLGGKPYATPTLWAAIQYLMPGEDAPEHRHTQHAFRFVVEGEGVWTVVNGDPVRCRAVTFCPSRDGTGSAPQCRQRADGLDRRPGHPVPVLHGVAVLRVRSRRDYRDGEGHSGAVPRRAVVGLPGPAPGVATRTPSRPRRC